VYIFLTEYSSGTNKKTPNYVCICVGKSARKGGTGICPVCHVRETSSIPLSYSKDEFSFPVLGGRYEGGGLREQLLNNDIIYTIVSIPYHTIRMVLLWVTT
jgi:hypothetical protein